MTPDEKRNVIVGIVLSIGAVVVLWLWSMHAAPPGAPSGTAATTNNMGGAGVTPPATTYTNYNIPAFNPAAPTILGPTTLGANNVTLGSSGSGGCGCNQCGVNDNLQNSSTNNFNALI